MRDKIIAYTLGLVFAGIGFLTLLNYNVPILIITFSAIMFGASFMLYNTMSE